MLTLKAALQSTKPLLGTLLTTASAEIAEALALIGFDWIFLDLEHGGLTLRDAQLAVQIIGERCLTLLRIPDATSENIKKALDTGCNGLIIPLVNSEAQARRIVSLSKYPPEGERSVGLGRAQGFGLRFAEYLKEANERTGIVVQVEHRDAVHEVDKILAVPGVDSVFVGPYDLSGSMGLLGQVDHPEVRGAVEKVRSACRNARVPLGIYCSNAVWAANEIRAGAKLVAVGTDITHMANAASKTLEALRKN